MAMSEEEYLKKQRKRKAREIQKATGVNYTTALRQVIAEEEAENGEA
ncbi:hypothetical protein SEA_CATERPILLAR_77 [Arthrobacter phage Caterpillar]|nr:hypothetical protein SEA_CATERPILLAR_77 [Arthrobacter phage Caterpillar]